jgi:nitronate monooxygenase
MKVYNKVTAALQVAYPIIQAPMLGVSTPAMAAAVANAGALGSLAVGGLSPDVTRQLIRDTKRLTAKPFAVNLFVHDIPEAGDLEPMRALLLSLAQKNGYELAAADLDNFKLYTYRDQLDILLEEDIRLVSFTFGCLDPASIALLKHKGIILMGTATCVREALILEAAGVDMVVVQGIEAGGHRGTFLEDMPLPEIGLAALLPQVKDAVKIPCIAAGAINSGASMNAAFALGADAVQIGTAFIATQESDAIPSYKKKLHEASDTDTELTRAFSGRWARGMRNKMIQDIAVAGIAIPPYPWQNSLTAKLRKLAQQANDPEYTNLWAGQAAATQWERSADVITDLVQQYAASEDPNKPL